ncbi:MAG: ATP-binding protein [Phycisphaerae bacterium]|nr:ATP-binding protein [Phycisphaerae bacterium]
MRARITGRERSAILSSLAAGVVPSIGLHHIQVGRKDEVNALLSDLAKVENDAAFIRFVVGRFGSGKTFFLNLVHTVALERKLVVASADITTQRRLHGTGGQARTLYSELMRNIASRSRPEGGALPNLIERWVSDLAHEVSSSGGTAEDVGRRLHDACKPLQELVSGHDFAKVIEQYYRGFLDHNEALQQAAIRWLRGEYTTKTEARQDLGVRTIIDDSSFYEYLKLMAGFVRIAGYAGLVVCIDELVVLSHRLNNKTARNNNYEAILRILNDCLQGSVQGLGFIFAATDDCLMDKRRGLFSYEALATRLAPNRFASDEVVDFSGPVLSLASLTPEDCYVLLHNIRRVHAKADDTNHALPDEAIEAFLKDCNQRMGAAYFLTPRETVKDFVGLLNVLEQNEQADWRTLLGAIKTTASDATDPYASVPEQEDGPDDEPVATRGDDDLASFKL